MNPVQEVKSIISVQSYMEAIWQHPKLDKLHPRIFRGQTDDWPLLPRLFRAGNSMELLLELEFRLLTHFKRRGLFLLPSMPGDPTDLMSLAQHHGLPTKLLDWSSNPLMALFFALDASIPLKKPVVWMFDPSIIQVKGEHYLRSGIEITDAVVVCPHSHSQRVVAQAGIHTFHPDKRPLNEYPLDKCRLNKLVINPDRAANIKEELRDMGIHCATVYGDLNSVCREIVDELQIHVR